MIYIFIGLLNGRIFFTSSELVEVTILWTVTYRQYKDKKKTSGTILS